MKMSHLPDDPRTWLTRAKSNLLLAQLGNQKGILFEDLCFEAQQAAEKALKAICLIYRIEFPKTHSIGSLTTLLEQAGVVLPPEILEADVLTSYAVQARYPQWDEPATEIEYKHAIEIASGVVDWASQIIADAY